MARIWQLIVEGYKEWQKHRCAQLAAGLAFYGVLGFTGASLIGLFIVVHNAALRASLASQTGKAGGKADAQILLQILNATAARHNSWVALAAGIVLLAISVIISALLLQDGLNAIWDRQEPAQDALKHIPQFLEMLALSGALLLLLFIGAGIHAYANRRHRLSLLTGILYQGGDLAVSVLVLTVLFIAIFAYVAPVRSSWKKVWLASFVSAILYERGQFGLAFYIGQMDPRSPYADLGAFVSIVLWLFYSAEVVYAGAIFTKLLSRGSRGSGT